MLINVKANTGLIIRKLQAYGITRLKRLFQIYGVPKFSRSAMTCEKYVEKNIFR